MTACFFKGKDMETLKTVFLARESCVLQQSQEWHHITLAYLIAQKQVTSTIHIQREEIRKGMYIRNGYYCGVFPLHTFSYNLIELFVVGFFWISQYFFMKTVIFSKNREDFSVSSLICIPFISFSGFIAPAKSFSMLQNISGKSRHHCFLSNL